MAGRGRKPLWREGAGGDGVGLGLAPCCSQNDSHLPIDACGWTLTQVLISSIDTHRLGLQSIFTWNSRSIPHSLQSPISLIRLSVLDGLRSWLTLCTSRHLQSRSPNHRQAEHYSGTLDWESNRPGFQPQISIQLCELEQVTSSLLTSIFSSV